jgi:hypothetical protein
VYVLIAVIGACQALGVAWLNNRIQTAEKAQVAKIEQVAGMQVESIDGLEKKINSNMERQIYQAIGEAIARERLQVEKAKGGR